MVLPWSISGMIKDQIKRPESSVQPCCTCVLDNNAARPPSCPAGRGGGHLHTNQLLSLVWFPTFTRFHNSTPKSQLNLSGSEWVWAGGEMKEVEWTIGAEFLSNARAALLAGEALLHTRCHRREEPEEQGGFSEQQKRCNPAAQLFLQWTTAALCNNEHFLVWRPSEGYLGSCVRRNNIQWRGSTAATALNCLRMRQRAALLHAGTAPSFQFLCSLVGL